MGEGWKGEGWKSGMGRLEGGRLEKWNGEGWNGGRLEGLKSGRGKVGMREGWKDSNNIVSLSGVEGYL